MLRAQGQFFQTLYDVPIMEGLIEIRSERVIFDSPSGRIVQVTAMSDNIDVNNVYSFYNNVLLQFGWIYQQKGLYYRDGETLRISHKKTTSGWLIHYDLVPSGASNPKNSAQTHNFLDNRHAAQ